MYDRKDDMEKLGLYLKVEPKFQIDSSYNLNETNGGPNLPQTLQICILSV